MSEQKSDRVNLPDLLAELTVAEIEDIRENLNILTTTIKEVPVELDRSFSSKLNRVLDIVGDVENIFRGYRKQLEKFDSSNNDRVSSDISNELDEIKKLLTEVKKQQPIIQKNGTGIITIVTTSLLTSLLSGTVLYYLLIYS